MHIPTRGARIWVHEQGTGPALLLIGGLSDPAESWQAQIDAFSDRYRVIAPDNRGAGRSAIPPGGIAIPGMAEDAADVLRELGVDRAPSWVSPWAARSRRSSRSAIPAASAIPTPTSARWF
jgi:pimeloyl-ACP methyl ester carboxylesterase